VPQPIAVCLAGAPEVLELAPVVHALRRGGVPHVVVATGRPTRMAADMLATLAIEPAIDLRSSARVDAASAVVGAALAFARPAAVVVAADTATALVAAPAAFSRGIPVAQVAAGALDAAAGQVGPAFARDAERRLVAHLATWHFAPDAAARGALVADGIDPAAIEVTGGTVCDAVRGIAERDGLLGRRPVAGARRVLVALRRGAGRDDADIAAGRMLARLAERADVEIALAAPRSPLLRAALRAHENVMLLGSARYADFVAALAASHVLLTDKPAALEAAAALGVPAVAVGDPAAALRDAERVLDDDALHRPLRLVPVAAADDGASQRIVARLTAGLGGAAVAEVHSARLAA
jgi:UDP-N-acetylglucosamine 2-epimerase (non-hydrolysing)